MASMENLNHVLAVFGEIIKIQIKVEGMKACNQERISIGRGESLAYGEEAFADAALKVGNLCNVLRRI